MGILWGDPWMVTEGERSPLCPNWEMLGAEGMPGQEMRHVGATDLWSEKQEGTQQGLLQGEVVGEGSATRLPKTQSQVCQGHHLPSRPNVLPQPLEVPPYAQAPPSSSKPVPKGHSSAQKSVESMAHQPVRPGYCWDNIWQKSPRASAHLPTHRGAQEGVLSFPVAPTLAQVPLWGSGIALVVIRSPQTQSSCMTQALGMGKGPGSGVLKGRDWALGMRAKGARIMCGRVRGPKHGHSKPFSSSHAERAPSLQG